MPVTLRLVILPVLAAVLLATVGCERQATTEVSAELARLEGEPKHVSWNVRFAVYNDDVPRAQIVAAYMAQYEDEDEDTTYTLFRDDPEEATGRRVTAYLFNDQGDSSAVLSANQLVFFDDDNRFDAEGDVQVETKEGKHLEGEHLAWYEEDAEVRTPGFVRITTPTDRVQGYGLVATEDLTSYELADVTGQTEVEDL